MTGQMTGECFVCESNIKGHAVLSNIEYRDGITEYCSYECRNKDMGDLEIGPKYIVERDNKLPWE